MAFLFSLIKVLSLEINHFHSNRKGVQALMLPFAVIGGLRGKTHRQQCQAEDILRDGAFLAGRQTSDLGISLGSLEAVYTDKS